MSEVTLNKTEDQKADLKVENAVGQDNTKFLFFFFFFLEGKIKTNQTSPMIKNAKETGQLFVLLMEFGKMCAEV